jgi:hypothetical protein
MRLSNIPDVGEEWKSISREAFGFSIDELVDDF